MYINLREHETKTIRFIAALLLGTRNCSIFCCKIEFWNNNLMHKSLNWTIMTLKVNKMTSNIKCSFKPRTSKTPWKNEIKNPINFFAMLNVFLIIPLTTMSIPIDQNWWNNWWADENTQDEVCDPRQLCSDHLVQSRLWSDRFESRTRDVSQL